MTNVSFVRVAVAGANGRMGRLAVQRLSNSDGVAYVGGFARESDASGIYDNLGRLFEEKKPDVLVDFTTHPATVEVARISVEHGVRPVIGSSGWTTGEREQLDEFCRKRGVPAMLVPNFAIGAVLMMRFAEQAARFFPSIEIVELHHDQKVDKPSGTAKLTGERIKAVTETDVPIHSVRLRGLVAHHEVLFGNTGELLTIRHDSLSRESFAAGILFAVQSVMHSHAGLAVGLDALLERALQ